VEPVFIDWKPTDRVLALSEEQKDEIKQRLNVTVETGEHQTAPPPIESFAEMVSTRPRQVGLMSLFESAGAPPEGFSGQALKTEELEGGVYVYILWSERVCLRVLKRTCI